MFEYQRCLCSYHFHILFNDNSSGMTKMYLSCFSVERIWDFVRIETIR